MRDDRQPRLKRIGALLFDGITALDVAGPMEAFTAARIPGDERSTTICYELLTIGLTNRSVVAESGLVIKPSTTLAACPRLDTLIIPGGRGLREPRTNRIIATWIKGRAATTRRIASVCTGIYRIARWHYCDYPLALRRRSGTKVPCTEGRCERVVPQRRTHLHLCWNHSRNRSLSGTHRRGLWPPRRAQRRARAGRLYETP